MSSITRIVGRPLLAGTALVLGSAAVAGTQFATVPLHFERAAGDGTAAASFVARGPGYGIRLASQGATLDLYPGTGRGERIALTLADGAPDAPATAGNVLPGRVNYLVRNDPAGWRTNVPTYEHVRYDEVYPGIDAVYYGRQNHLEYDFVVAPGADPAQIAIRIDGADALRKAPDGDLVLTLAGGELRQQRPVAYQLAGSRRTEVSADFVLGEANEVRFELGDYDPSRPLVIDPVVSYATFLGGSRQDEGTSVAADAAGNTYVFGTTTSLDFPGRTDTTEDRTTFVAKFDPSGATLLYTTFLGGSRNEYADDIEIADDGTVVVAGHTTSDDFPVTPGAVQTLHRGGFTSYDLFVTGLKAAGDALAFSTYLGGSGQEFAADVALRAAGGVFVTGETESLDFPTSVTAYQLGLGSAESAALVARLDRDATQLTYATLLSGSVEEAGKSIVVDNVGRATIAGVTRSPDFPTTPDAWQAESPDQQAYRYDGFVARFDVTGSTLEYATYLGGAREDAAVALAYGADDTLYVLGFTWSPDFPTTLGAWQPVLGGSLLGDPQSDIFLSRFNAAGNELLYSTYLGGSHIDMPGGLDVDAAGNVIIAGWSFSDDYPVSPDAMQPTNRSNNEPWNAEGVISYFLPSGPLRYSTYFGGTLSDLALDAAFDDSGNVYVVGRSTSGDLQTSEGAFQPTNKSSAFVDSAFLLKLTDMQGPGLPEPR